jgi:hypothetical protein
MSMTDDALAWAMIQKLQALQSDAQEILRHNSASNPGRAGPAATNEEGHDND